MPRTLSCAVTASMEFRALRGYARSKILSRKEYWHDERGVDRNGRHRQRGASRYALPRDAGEWPQRDRLRVGQEEEAPDHHSRRGPGQPRADALRSHQGAHQLPAQGRDSGGAAAAAAPAVPAALAGRRGATVAARNALRCSRESFAKARKEL